MLHSHTIGQPFAPDGESRVYLRFVRRKASEARVPNAKSYLRTTYGIVSSTEGTFFIWGRNPAGSPNGPAQVPWEKEFVLDAAKQVLPLLPAGASLILSPINIDGIRSALGGDLSSMPGTALNGEDDPGPIAPARMACLAVIHDAQELPSPEHVLPYLEAAHEKFSRTPDMNLARVNDDLPQRMEERAPPTESAVAAPPSALLVGKAGVGKSTLVASLLGTGGHDLPPSVGSRSTLFPTRFTNNPHAEFFSMRAVMRPSEESHDLLVGLFQAVVEAAAVQDGERDPKDVIAGSADMRLPLNLVLGRDGIAALLSDLREIAGFDIVDRQDAIAALAWDILKSIDDRIRELPFGRVSETSHGRCLCFDYSSRDLKATVAAGRRFFTLSRIDAGKAFGPFCASMEFSGPFLLDSPAFSLIDHRGVDHEGSLSMDLPADVVRSARECDRVIILMDTQKAGDREDTRALRQLIAEGLSAKVLFAATRADVPAQNGKDVYSWVCSGVENALNALAADVGRQAAASVMRRARGGRIYIFGGLDAAEEHDYAPMTQWPPADEAGTDNADNAVRLITLISTERPEIDDSTIGDLAEADIRYEAEIVGSSLDTALEKVREDFDNLYGAPGTNRGVMSWQRIKAETRRVLRFFTGGTGTLPEREISAISEALAARCVAAMSLALDSPLSQSELDPDLAQQQRDALRRAVVSAVEDAVIRQSILRSKPVWEASGHLSMVTFGPGSTVERNRVLRGVLDMVQRGRDGETVRLMDMLQAYVTLEGRP